MDFSFSEQEQMLQNMAREFAQREILPQAMEIDRSSEFPFDLAQKLGNLGFQGLPFPKEYGGAGAGYISYAVALEQICQASLTIGAIMSVNTVPEEALFRFGSEAQKRRFLVPLAEGKLLGGIAFTEAETGSDPAAITTRAKLSDNTYLVTGQKQFVALAPAANLLLVFAKEDAGRLSAFIMDTSSPGYTVREPCETLGLRGLGTSVVYLDEIPVPVENLVGESEKGFDILLEVISVEKLGVAVQGVGVVQAALELSLDYAQQRKAYNRPIAQMPSIQCLLAEMVFRIEAGRWLAYKVAFLRDRGENIQQESAVVKLFCSQMAVEVTRMAMQVHGAYGTMKTLSVERLYRDAKMTEIYVVVSETQRAIIARGALRAHK